MNSTNSSATAAQPYNNTISSPSLCISHALFIPPSDGTFDGAPIPPFELWILFLLILSFTLSLSQDLGKILRIQTARLRCYYNFNDPIADTADPNGAALVRRVYARLPPRPRFSHLEAHLLLTTIWLGANIFGFLTLSLIIEAQRWCSPGPLSTASYVAQYVFQILYAGAAVVTALVCWINAFMAVRGAREEELWDEWVVWRVEGWILVGPFIAVAVVVVAMWKGPGVARQMGVVKAFRGWLAERREGMRGLWTRAKAAWVRRGGKVFVDAPERMGIDLEGALTLELGPVRKGEGDEQPVREAGGVSSPSSALPTYTSDNALS